MKKRAVFSLLLAALLTLAGCGAGSSEFADASDGADKTQASSAEDGKTQTTELANSVSAADMFTDNDLEIGYDEETAARITLSGDGASSTSDAVRISGSTVTITDEGTYILSGTLDGGMVAVSAGKQDKVRLVLDGVQITSPTSAAIYVLEADKVFLTTAPGSENSLANGGEYTAIDENNIDAVIFSKADLTLNGTGTLTVSAAAGHGIVSKDDLVFTCGTYIITAAGKGISGKDSVRIANGTYTVTAGKDAIHAENADDAGLGFLYISDGSFDLKADGDGVSAGASLQIDGGSFTVTTGEGSASVTMPTENMGFWPGSGFPEQDTQSQADGTVSQKGFKSDGPLTVTGGSFVTDTADDSFHAAGDIVVTGGDFTLKSGDDGVHADTAVTIRGGKFAIPYCYEGIEGLSVTIEGGNFDITAVDDGINAAGGTDGSGFGGGRPGDRFSASSDNAITIGGGTFVIVSDGDCVDSNGALTISGGKLDLTCNGNGNTALDCDGTFTHSGGDITTNDGSENNPGQMGGMGGPGGMGWPDGMGRPDGSDGMGWPDSSEGMGRPDGFPGGTEGMGRPDSFPGGTEGQGGTGRPGAPDRSGTPTDTSDSPENGSV